MDGEGELRSLYHGRGGKAVVSFAVKGSLNFEIAVYIHQEESYSLSIVVRHPSNGLAVRALGSFY